MNAAEGSGWPSLPLDRRPTLLSPRLTLVPPSMGRDADEFIAAVNDMEVVRWLARVPHPYTLREAAFFFTMVAPEEFAFVVRRRDDGVLVGSVGLRPTAPDQAEIGYWYGRAHWRLGFATEVAQCLLAYAFAELKLARVTAVVAEENPASLRVLHKAGFVPTGRSVRPVLFLGRDAPHIELVLTRPTDAPAAADQRI